MTLRTCYGALQIVVLLLLLYLPDANAYCAEFADYRNVIIHAEHVVHRRGYCFHFGCMFVCLYVCMYVSALERKR